MLKRLSSREEYSQALKSPVVARTAHFVLHRFCPQAQIPSPLPAPVRVGCVLPKRWARRAVTRNLLRRLIFAQAEMGLVAGPDTAQQAYVVRLRTMIDKSLFTSASSQALRQHMRDELITLFGQAQQRPPIPAATPI